MTGYDDIGITIWSGEAQEDTAGVYLLAMDLDQMNARRWLFSAWEA